MRGKDSWGGLEGSAMPEGEGDGPVQIHKYPNRRYYDTSSSSYVTLEQLREMVRGGREIRVSDSKSGQDITARVLAQIVLETEPLKLDVIPLKLLHELVRMNVRTVGGWWEGYYNQAARAISETGRSIEKGVGRAMQIPESPQAVIPDWLKLAWGPLAPPSFLFGREGGAEGSATPPPAVDAGNDEGGGEAKGSEGELLRQVEQMGARLAALEKKLGEKNENGGKGADPVRKKDPVSGKKRTRSGRRS